MKGIALQNRRWKLGLAGTLPTFARALCLMKRSFASASYAYRCLPFLKRINSCHHTVVTQHTAPHSAY